MFGGETRDIERVGGEETLELWDKLLELPESKERAILGPIGASDSVPSLADQYNTGIDNCLSRRGISNEPGHGRLADTVHETKICV